MPSKHHAIQRWTALIRLLLRLKPGTRRGAGLGRLYEKAVTVYLEEGKEQESPVENKNGPLLPGTDQDERLGDILQPFRDLPSAD